MMSCNKKTLILAYPISTSILLALFRPWPQFKFYSFSLQFSLGFPRCLYRRSFTLSISGLVSLYYSWGCQHIPPNPSVVDQLHIFYHHIIHILLHVLEHGVDQSLVRSSSVFRPNRKSIIEECDAIPIASFAKKNDFEEVEAHVGLQDIGYQVDFMFSNPTR